MIVLARCWLATKRKANVMADRALTRTTLKVAIAAGVPDGKARIAIWDTRPKGLALILRASGSTSWVFVYRPRGSPKGTPSRTVTLGNYPTLDLEEARREAVRQAGVGKF